MTLSKYDKFLITLFVLTLPLSNPWVRGDGVGYYAFARSMLIEHRLDFTKDWLAANTSFRMARVTANGQLTPGQYTATGHIDNHFSVGPAILWSPFLVTTHLGVLVFNRIGGQIAADGYSRPYLIMMALATAMYGFLGLLISFHLARAYVPEHWAFLATLGVWFGSSLPVYMYFNPSWSHAHSVFVVALFVWYWVRTRGARTSTQWMILGAIGGLMLDTYSLNGICLLLPLLESFQGYWAAFGKRASQEVRWLLFKNAAFALILLGVFFPTLLARRTIYGSYLRSGYEHLWVWNSPYVAKVCFSADHGLFTWTPILLLSVVGLFLLRRYDRVLGIYSIVVFLVFLYVIGSYEDWDGISSFGNRFFISLTPLFILGLAAFIGISIHAWHDRRGVEAAWSTGVVFLIFWNLGLVYQWGNHLIPVRGPISWHDAAYNQVVVVPAQAARSLRSYLTHRQEMMDRIEQSDVNQINRLKQPEGTVPTP